VLGCVVVVRCGGGGGKRVWMGEGCAANVVCERARVADDLGTFNGRVLTVALEVSNGACEGVTDPTTSKDTNHVGTGSQQLHWTRNNYLEVNDRTHCW
jgi:hypothetical protein